MTSQIQEVKKKLQYDNILPLKYTKHDAM